MVKFDFINDTYEISGICPLAETCTKKLWDESEKAPDEVSIMKTSQETLAFICAQADCNFSCGFTIDGSSGTAGACKRGE